MEKWKGIILGRAAVHELALPLIRAATRENTKICLEVAFGCLPKRRARSQKEIPGYPTHDIAERLT